MIEKLQTKQNRKYFFLIIGLTIIVLFILRYYVIPHFRGDAIEIPSKILLDLTDKLFISTLVSVGLATYIFWLTPTNKTNAQIKILQPIEIGQTY